MNQPQPRLQLLVLVCAIAALWLGALGIDAAARLMASFYTRMNADLPDGTVRTLHAAQAHAHWLGAAFGTLLLGALFKRRPAAFAPAAALILAVALLAATAAAFTLAWPTGLCGELRPAWGGESRSSDQCR